MDNETVLNEVKGNMDKPDYFIVDRCLFNEAINILTIALYRLYTEDNVKYGNSGNAA